MPAPTPIYGSLIIESTPNYATIYLDGKAIGETPKFVKEILIGEHEVKLAKEGRLDYVGTVTISRGEQQQIKAQLEKDGTAPEVINDVQEEQVVVEPQTTVNLEKRVAKMGFRKKGFVMRPEVGYSFTNVQGVTGHLSLGYQFGPHFYLGGICGYDGNCYTSSTYLSYYYHCLLYTLLGLDSRWYILNRNWTPIIGCKFGLALNDDFESHANINLKAGCAYNNWELTLGMGGGIGLEYGAVTIDFSYRFGFTSSKGKK